MQGIKNHGCLLFKYFLAPCEFLCNEYDTISHKNLNSRSLNVTTKVPQNLMDHPSTTVNLLMSAEINVCVFEIIPCLRGLVFVVSSGLMLIKPWSHFGAPPPEIPDAPGRVRCHRAILAKSWTISSAGHIWKCRWMMAPGSLQGILPRLWQLVNSHQGPVGVLPCDGTSAIARHCDCSSAVTKPLGDSLAAALQPSHDGAYEVCLKGSTHAFQMHNR